MRRCVPMGPHAPKGAFALVDASVHGFEAYPLARCVNCGDCHHPLLHCCEVGHVWCGRCVEQRINVATGRLPCRGPSCGSPPVTTTEVLHVESSTEAHDVNIDGIERHSLQQTQDTPREEGTFTANRIPEQSRVRTPLLTPSSATWSHWVV